MRKCRRIRWFPTRLGKNHFTLPIHDYEVNEFSIKYVNEKWDNINSEILDVIANDDIHLNFLGEEQRNAMNAFLNLCCVEIISIVDDNEAPNAMIFSGYGGTGKSFTIKAIVQEILKSNNGMCTILIMAPTGKAALNAVTNAIYCNFFN